MIGVNNVPDIEKDIKAFLWGRNMSIFARNSKESSMACMEWTRGQAGEGGNSEDFCCTSNA